VELITRDTTNAATVEIMHMEKLHVTKVSTLPLNRRRLSWVQSAVPGVIKGSTQGSLKFALASD